MGERRRGREANPEKPVLSNPIRIQVGPGAAGGVGGHRDVISLSLTGRLLTISLITQYS